MKWNKLSDKEPPMDVPVLGYWNNLKMEAVVFTNPGEPETNSLYCYYLQDGDVPNNLPKYWCAINFPEA